MKRDTDSQICIVHGGGGLTHYFATPNLCKVELGCANRRIKERQNFQNASPGCGHPPCSLVWPPANEVLVFRGIISVATPLPQGSTVTSYQGNIGTLHLTRVTLVLCILPG